jgi:hypothetical protein
VSVIFQTTLIVISLRISYYSNGDILRLTGLSSWMKALTCSAQRISVSKRFARHIRLSIAISGTKCNLGRPMGKVVTIRWGSKPMGERGPATVKDRYHVHRERIETGPF